MAFFGSTEKLSLVHTVVFYRKETGEVRYTHHEVFYEGAILLAKDKIEKKALAFAEKRLKQETSQLKVLHLSNYDFKRGAKYVVDVKNFTLIEKAI